MAVTLVDATKPSRSYFPRNAAQKKQVLEQLGPDPHGLDPNKDAWLFHESLRPYGFDSVKRLRKWILNELTVRKYPKTRRFIEKYGFLEQWLHLFFKNFLPGVKGSVGIIRHMRTILERYPEESKRFAQEVASWYVPYRLGDRKWIPKFLQKGGFLKAGVAIGKCFGLVDRKIKKLFDGYDADWDDIVSRFTKLHRESISLAKPFYLKWGFPDDPWKKPAGSGKKKRSKSTIPKTTKSWQNPAHVPKAIDTYDLYEDYQSSQIRNYRFAIAAVIMIALISIFLNCYLCYRVNKVTEEVDVLRVQNSTLRSKNKTYLRGAEFKQRIGKYQSRKSRSRGVPIPSRSRRRKSRSHVVPSESSSGSELS